jgi:hypothetical protein
MTHQESNCCCKEVIMKVKWISVSLLIFSLNRSVYAVDTNSVVSYWPADEGSGEKVADIVGGFDGTLLVGPGWEGKPHQAGWGEGKFGKGLAFDEQKEWFVDIGTNATLDQLGKPKSAFTVVYWMKSPKVAGKGRTVEKGSSGWTQGWHCALVNGRAFSEGCDNVAPGWQLPGAKMVADDDWHHLTHIFDLNTNEAKLYVDGQLDVEKDISSDPDIAGADWQLTFGTTGKIQNAWHEFLTGTLDEIAIFSKSLSEPEIKEVMQAPLGDVLAVDATDKLVTTWGDIKARHK